LTFFVCFVIVARCFRGIGSAFFKTIDAAMFSTHEKTDSQRANPKSDTRPPSSAQINNK
jgi:hypothetical protein